jgi:uncharacterized protein
MATWHHGRMVASLIRYPVKSMLGEQLAVTAVTSRGIEGDRLWALLDRPTGKVVSAKNPRRWKRMLMLRARLLEPGAIGVAIRLPDGGEVVSGDGAVHEVLSTFLGQLVLLTNQAPGDAAIEREDPTEEGAPSGTVNTSQLGRGAPAGTFFDYAPVHLITTATLCRLRELASGSHFHPARFRPNLVLDLPGTAGFVENHWPGRLIHLGPEVVLRVQVPTPRCSVPTLAQPGLDHDPGVIRTVARHNRVQIDGVGTLPCAGAYAEVLRTGIVRRGDLVSLEPPD